MDDLLATQSAIRAEVCTECFRRPDVGNPLPSGAARSCEPSCDLFTYLPRLVNLVHRFGAEPPCGYELAIHNLPCGTCASSECAEDNCRSQRPLEKYADKALAVLEWIEQHGKGRN
jgi:hypothetical protein